MRDRHAATAIHTVNIYAYILFFFSNLYTRDWFDSKEIWYIFLFLPVVGCGK